jgi:Zn-dependent protease with chaperone function
VKKPNIQEVCQAGSFLLCVFLSLQITSSLEGTEFSGGWLTGPLLSMQDIGAALFIVAVVLTFVFSRVAAAIGLASSALCLPLYLFFIAPVSFAQIFARGHEFKVQPAPGFHWHMWPVAGLLALAVTLYVCIHRVVATSQKQIPQRA